VRRAELVHEPELKALILGFAGDAAALEAEAVVTSDGVAS
jgi:hypothetical protein